MKIAKRDNDPSYLIEPLYYCGQLLSSLSKYETGRKVYQQTLVGIDRSLYPQRNSERIVSRGQLKAACLIGLAAIARMKADYEEAREGYEQTLEIYQKFFGQAHPNMTELRERLASLQESLQNSKEPDAT